MLRAVRPDGLEDAPQLQLDIDRDKASRAGRELRFGHQHRACRPRWARPMSTTSPTAGRLQRVVVQADAPARMQPEDLLRLARPTPRPAGAAVGVCHHALGRRAHADHSLQRLSGDAHRRRTAPGQSTGAAMAEMERLAGAAAPGLCLRVDRHRARRSCRLDRHDPVRVLACWPCFLCLAALYESWTIPLAVILVVPLGVLGVLLAESCAGWKTTSTSRSG
jgi:multidrug efflux pump